MADSETEVCGICYSDVSNPAAEFVTLPCSHDFHPDCIWQWIEISPNKDCPHCRASLYYGDCRCVPQPAVLVAGADLSSPKLDLSGACAECLAVPDRLRFCVFCDHVHPANGDCRLPEDEGFLPVYSIFYTRSILVRQRGGVRVNVLGRVHEAFHAARRHLDHSAHESFILGTFDEIMITDLLLRETGCESLEITRRVANYMTSIGDYRTHGWRDAVLAGFELEMAKEIRRFIAQERSSLPSVELNRVVRNTTVAISHRFIPFAVWQDYVLSHLDAEMAMTLRDIIVRRQVNLCHRPVYKQYIGNFIQRTRGQDVPVPVLDKVMASLKDAIKNSNMLLPWTWKDFVLQSFDREMGGQADERTTTAGHAVHNQNELQDNNNHPSPTYVLLSVEVPEGYCSAETEETGGLPSSDNDTALATV